MTKYSTKIMCGGHINPVYASEIVNLRHRALSKAIPEPVLNDFPLWNKLTDTGYDAWHHAVFEAGTTHAVASVRLNHIVRSAVIPWELNNPDEVDTDFFKRDVGNVVFTLSRFVIDAGNPIDNFRAGTRLKECVLETLKAQAISGDIILTTAQPEKALAYKALFGVQKISRTLKGIPPFPEKNFSLYGFKVSEKW